MARRPSGGAGVTLSYGDRSVSLPFGLVAALGVIVAGSIAVTAANGVAPWLLGTRPLFAVPGALETLLGLVAYAAAVVGLIVACLLLFGWQESLRADRRFIAHDKLVPLAEAARQGIWLAPNLPQAESAALADRLAALLAGGMLNSVHIPTGRTDARDGNASDRVFVSSALDARAVRRALARLGCNEIARVPARHRARLARESGAGEATMWLLVWD